MKDSRFLMCPPTFFGVEYVINPWMEGQIHATNTDLACVQWQQLHSALAEQASIASLAAVPGLPDLVFTANAALLYGSDAILSSFRFEERRPEARHFANWLSANGFRIHTLPTGVYFEGAGDALFDRVAAVLWLGHGQRSDLAAGKFLREVLKVDVQPLRLRSPNFYHLDTCFCPLERGYLLYYPAAFDEEGNAAIEARVPEEKRIPVSDYDATHFACNAVNLGKRVVVNAVSDELRKQLSERGFQVTTTALTEFIRAGGAAKCLSLRLDEPFVPGRNGC